MPDGSEVEIEVIAPDGDTTDITNHAVIADASFDISAGAQPATAFVSLRDMDQELISTTFPLGSRLKCRIDGQDLWAGYTLRRGRTSFFPAGDGLEDTKARRWILYGIDNNVLLDKRVIRNTSNYLQSIPDVTTPTFDGVLLQALLSTYSDAPAGFDITTQLDNIYEHPETGERWAWVEQGKKVRQQFQDLANLSGAVYYVGPDDAYHYHALQTVESPWGFSDRPNRAPIVSLSGFDGAYWGFREMSADEDGSQFATDAFVWGGSPFAEGGSIVFKRSTDEALEDDHGKWQLAETHFNETNYKLQTGVTQRANVIVFGNPAGTPGGTGTPGSVVGEGPRGLRYPQWNYSFAWTTRDVPALGGVKRHLYPGDIVPIQLWAFSEDEGDTPFTKFLPLRTLKITFPSGATDGRAHVLFKGTFDLRNEDPFTLWRYLRKREPEIAKHTMATSSNSTTIFVYGSFYQDIPSGAVNGSNTLFTGPSVGYVAGTSRFMVNGLEWIAPLHYTESDPDAGEVTLSEAPLTGDDIYMIARTLST